MTMQCKVAIARFPGNFHEDPDTTSWIIKTVREIDAEIYSPNSRISSQHMFVKSDTPITMVRNQAIEWALQNNIDYLLMIDNDMKPDWARHGKPLAPFWKSAFDWIFRREAPALICSPYVGPNPLNNIYIFRWRNNNNYDDSFSMSQYTREEAAERGGIEKVASFPTGLFLMDMRLIKRLPQPYFEYEWDGRKDICDACGQPGQYSATKKCSTEDVYFGRNVTNLWHDVPGAGCFVNWDSWSAHIKRVYCEPPELPHPDHMGKLMLRAMERNRDSNERLVLIGEGDKDPVSPQVDEKEIERLVSQRNARLKKAKRRKTK